MPAPIKSAANGKMEQFCDSPGLKAWKCERGLNLCFGSYLQVVGGGKTLSEETFFFLKIFGFEAFRILSSQL